MKEKVTSKQAFNAHKIETENDLDDFLSSNVSEFDSIHQRGGLVTVSLCGTKLFSFEYGQWLVVFSDLNIKAYYEEYYIENFCVVA